jgi:SAM-dependent methyltransferase
MRELTDLPAVEPAAYWSHATVPFRSGPSGGSWRQHCDILYRELLDRWLVPTAAPRALKTDLFDEVAGDGLCCELRRFAGRVHGVDVADAVVAGARAGRTEIVVTQADVRRLPYRDSSFELVVSNSTLDHFDARADIAVALRELSRVTAVGGTLVISIDNLANPIIALRSVLPFKLLRALGLVPYYVGATTTRRGLVDLLEQAGFSVQATTWIMHVPRVVAVPICARWDRRTNRASIRLLRRLSAWERLGRSPIASWTGHYVAALAVRE